jgi:pimeloyl-ACP methyl ester carboxylesterase
MKIRANGVELYYERYGSGEPVIFSHGWLDNLSVWKPQADILAKDHTVVLYDLRGHGASDKPEGEYSVQAMVHDLDALIKELKLDKVTLVGFSMGGALSLVYTLQHPETVSRLALIGTAARMPRRAYALLLPMHLFSYQSLIKRYFSKSRFYRASQKMTNAFVSSAKRVPKRVAYDSLKELIKRYDIRDRVSEIRVPTLIVQGERDPGMQKAVLYLHNHVAGSKLHVVPGAGHEVMVEKPEEVSQILQEFLNSAV